MRTIDPTEFINVHSYEGMCDTVWDGESEPESGVVYCPTELVHKFFQKCRKNLYVLVSGCCDYGVVYQKDNHPNGDLFKWVQAQDWNHIVSMPGPYLCVPIGPACVPENCNSQDRFSVKIYAKTLSTFNAIPDNIVHWFCTNLAVREDRVSWLPFGLNDHGEGLSILPEFIGKPKRKLLYVNFQDHTAQRMKLKDHYTHWLDGWATVRSSANVPVRQFLNEMAEHKFVLCPSGNGLDCYRTYEALYLGAIPVIEDGVFAQHLAVSGLPVCVVPDLMRLTPAYLCETYERMLGAAYSLEKLTASYWQNAIAACRNGLASV